jgi:6-phosphogluconate dehydrogenase (decarboxylating)
LNIGFLGLGRMGFPLSELLTKDHHLVAFDPVAPISERAENNGEGGIATPCIDAAIRTRKDTSSVDDKKLTTLALMRNNFGGHDVESPIITPITSKPSTKENTPWKN